MVSRSLNSFMFSKICVTYYQIPTSWFLIDIDFISMILEILLDGPSSFFGARLFGNCQHFGLPIFVMYIDNIFQKNVGIFLYF